MRKRFRILLLGAIVGLGLGFLAVAESGAETFPLELKRLESTTPSQGGAPAGYIRMTRGQNFSMRAGAVQSNRGFIPFGRPSPMKAILAANFFFSKIVTKEPAKYNSENPFRGVAKLGSGQYGFVLDCSDEKETDSCRFHFDLNHNGDLTDDKVIEGEESAIKYPANYSAYEFPRVDLTIDVDGAEVDYAFFFGVSSRTVPIRNLTRTRVLSSSNESETSKKESEKPKPKETKKAVYVSARLIPAVYREGKITLDGKPKHVVLLDSNGNGRFDDLATVRKSSIGRASPQYGDALLVDPESNGANRPSSYYATRNLLTSPANMGGSFYELAVTPAGDQITLSPTPTPTGHIALPSNGFRAMVYRDKAIIEISGDKAEPVSLPAGEWKLAWYAIDLTGRWEPSKEKEAKEGSSLLKVLAGSLVADSSSTASRTRMTRISAYGYNDTKAVQVTEGETVTLPYGQPYKTVVKTTGSVQGGKTVDLRMSLVGSGGEKCRGLSVSGSRPKPPEFTITTPDGEEITTGRFKWG